MPALFRVFPYLASAKVTDPGGAFYVPRQGAGRIDSPGAYSVLYLSNAAEGAVAEAFGRFPEWTQSILRGNPALPGSVRAIAQFHLDEDAPVCDLDDPSQLLALGLRPSDVVSRNYDTTRAWARRLHDQRQWIGVKWWSFYNPAWYSFGFWDIRTLRLEAVRPLRLSDAEVLEAARTIVRRVAPPATS